jgi:hypothetical protein
MCQNAGRPANRSKTRLTIRAPEALIPGDNTQIYWIFQHVTRKTHYVIYDLLECP